MINTSSKNMKAISSMKRLNRVAGYAALVAMLWLAGCGGKGGGTGAGASTSALASIVPRFAYATNFNDGTVSMYTVDAATGQWRNNGYVTAGINPHSLVVHPSGKFVYVSNYGGGAIISAYAVGSDGRLKTIAAPFSCTKCAPRGLAIDPTGSFLYVTLSMAGTVSAYSIHADGTLTWIADVSVSQPYSIALDPAGKFAYVTSFIDGTVSAFRVESTGALTAIDTDAVTAGTQTSIVSAAGAHNIVFDPSGRYAYVANYSDNTVSSFRLESNGALTGLGKVLGCTGARTLAVHPSGDFVYCVCNRVSSGLSVLAYGVNKTTGALTNIVNSVAPGANPSGIAVDASGKHLSVTTSGANQITTYDVDPSTGYMTNPRVMTARSGVLEMTMLKGTAPVMYTPKFAYVANAGANSVSAFSIDNASGTLTAVGSAAPAGTYPVSVAVDPSGRFAYAANKTANSVSAYSIGATGALTPIDADAGSTGVQPSIPAGTAPLSVAIDPSGRFLYVANVGAGVADPGTLSAYSIDSGTGALTPVAGSPFAAGNGPDSVVVDPSGRFVYAANYGWPGSGTVSAYAIDAGTGALTPVAGSPFAAGNGSDSIVVDSSGRFVYVANLLADTVSAFMIDAGTGALTKSDADAVTAGSQDFALPSGRPVSIAVDPSRALLYLATACGNAWAFAIDATSGALTRIDAAPGGLCGAYRDAPDSIAVDTSGRFVYVLDYSSNGSLAAYVIETTTGALTSAAGSPFVVEPSAKSVVTTGVIQ